MSNRNHRRWLCLIVLSVLCVPAFADNWSGFRGDGRGKSKDTGLPATWSGDSNIVWRTPLPGFGASSPITHGDKIFVTGYSGYGAGAGGEKSELKLHVTCLSRSTGKVLWDKSIAGSPRVKDYRGFVALHGYASQTPVTDGKAVYAFFGRSGVVAYDMKGKELWQQKVGNGTHGFGTGTSPLLVDDMLIVNASVESGNLVGIDKKTGNIKWKTPGIRSSWNTPLLVQVKGRKEVVLSMSGRIAAYDPQSGNQLWQCQTNIRDYICTSVVEHAGIIYALGGRSGRVFAVRAGGNGDVGSDRIVWEKNRLASNVPSPVYHRGHLYFVNQGGQAFCVDALTGKTVKRKRLNGTGRVYGSIVIADNKIFCISRRNGAYILSADKKMDVLAQNKIAGDRSIFNASPVISQRQILLRSDKFLYCIGKVQRVP